MRVTQSIQFRALLIFVLIGCAVVMLGITMLFGVQRMSTASEQIIDEGVPVIRSAQQMLLALERANESLIQAVVVQTLIDVDAVREAEATFNSAIITYEMFSTALRLGSDTTAFRLHHGGILYGAWVRRGLDQQFAIQPTTAGIRTLLDATDAALPTFR